MRLSSRAGVIGLAALALALSATAAEAAGPECDPLAYGAVGDGVTDNTTAIQSAIDKCEATYGGGVVRLSAVPDKSTYLTSPIRLADHIRLQLDKGVTLLGTTDHSKYHVAFLNYPFQANEALVSAYHAVDTGIIGPGTIDGQGGAPALDGGPSWWALPQATGETIDGTTWYAAPYADIPTSNGAPRPWLVEFYECTGVTVNDLTLTNAPTSGLMLRYSQYITVSELSVTVTPDPLVAHTDGIDLIGSSNATLISLDIKSGGDSIALKSGLPLNVPAPDDPNEAGLPQQPARNIQIVNSRFANGNGIVVGGEAANGVYNVMATNITATGTTHGLQIKADRTAGNQATGDYNIWVQNLTMTDVRQPLAIGADDRSGDGAASPSDSPQPVIPTTPNIHDVTIKTATATGATEGSLIVGLPEACIRNVVLDHVNLATNGTGIQLRNMTGSFSDVTSTPRDPTAPFMVQENVTVTTAGTTPAITNTPPLGAQPACGSNPGN